MSEPMVYVWPVRSVPGCVGFDEAGMPLDPKGQVCEVWPAKTLSAALAASYKTDAHFVPYSLVNSEGESVGAPRVNRAAWEQFHELGYWLRFQCIPLDFDDPIAHASGEPASDEWRAKWWGETLPAVESIVGCATVAYETKGGARAVVVLPEAIEGGAYLDIMAGLVAEAEDRGIVVDKLKELQRCYRLPFVTRDGKKEKRRARLDDAGVMDYEAMGRLAMVGQERPMGGKDAATLPERREMPARPPGANERPGEVFERVRAWSDVLSPQGWKFGGMNGSQESWYRPGKKPEGPPSALTNYMGRGKLWVFTTGDGALEAGRSYDKIGAYARLSGLDFSAASRQARDELVSEGHMRGWEERPARRDSRGMPEMPAHLAESPPVEWHEDAKLSLVSAAVVQRKSKPQIVIRAGDNDGMMAEAAAALARDESIYTRAGWVVEAMQTADGFRLVPLEKAAMRGVMERNAAWVRMVSRKSGGEFTSELIASNVDEHVVNGFVSTPRHWMGLRDVKNVHALPVVRPDGTVAGEGYDPVTRLLIRYDGVKFGEIGTTRKDAEAAAAMLLDIFAEFPFESEDDRSVAVALVVTACIRRVMSLCPGTLVDSPSSGIGKGLVINVASIVATGNVVEPQPQPKDEDELTKLLFSALREGSSHIAFDNVSGKFGGEAYDMLMTSEVFKGRVLGHSKTQTVPASALVTISGRNVAFRGDAAGRTLRCRLVTESEQPDKGRTFKYQPLEAHVQANRGDLVAACLTVVRAYLLAGRPCEMPPLRMYYDWCRMVREPLIWLGMSDPVRTIDKQRVECDVDLAAYGELAHAMYEAFGDRSMTMTRVVKEANAPGPWFERRERLRDAIQELTGVESTSPKVQALLGYKMRSNAGRPFDGLKLGRVGKVDGADPVRGRDGVLFQVTVVGDGPTHTTPPEAARLVNIVTGKAESLGKW